jgi:general secretion pathway protein F
MPVFSYKAMTTAGKTVKGLVDADNAQKARARLRGDGLYPVEIQETAGGAAKSGGLGRGRRSFSFGRSRRALLTNTTRQLATLLTAGIPLVNALSTIQEQTEDQDFGHRLALIREDVTRGESFAAALTRHPEVFPSSYVHLIRAGELSGGLGTVLERLADNLEISQARRANIASKLLYPVFMLVVGAGVLIFVLSYIIPTVTGLFDSFEAVLPLPTRILLSVSGFLQEYWYLVPLVVIAAAIWLRRSLKREKGYRRLEALLFRLPLIGQLTRRLRLAQIMRQMSVMTSGGVNLTTALTITAKAMGYSVYGQALNQAATLVGQGRSLADGMAASGVFPPVARRMVAVGESSGALNDMLERVARNYEQETDRALAALTSLVEPIIIICMGFLMGFVIISVLLPIFDLSALVG